MIQESPYQSPARRLRVSLYLIATAFNRQDTLDMLHAIPTEAAAIEIQRLLFTIPVVSARLPPTNGPIACPIPTMAVIRPNAFMASSARPQSLIAAAMMAGIPQAVAPKITPDKIRLNGLPPSITP